jgi:dTDP-4-amino-4,6-dideoxygalactose transaminase
VSEPIPFGDLRRTYAHHRTEFDRAVHRVLERGWFVLGEELAAFEDEFARFCGGRYAVGVGNGTEALQLALMAAGIGPGDEVITTPFTAAFTALAISATGATPVFADIDQHTATISPAAVEAAITPSTAAIVPVHLYGQPADMDALRAIADRHHLFLLEDAAQAHGARYRGRPVGALGDAAAFSFYPSKNLGAFGDAGAVVTDDAGLAERLRMLRNGGQRSRYDHVLRGINSRLDELQAAILRVRLRHLPEETERRRAIAHRYVRGLSDTSLTLPTEAPYAYHVYHLFVVRTPGRDELATVLRERGIGTAVHYPTPLHLQEAYRELGGHPGDHPVAERWAREELSLPMYPELTDEEAMQIVSTLVDMA